MALSAGIAGLFLALTLAPMIDDSLKKEQHLTVEIGVGDVNPQADDVGNGVPKYMGVPKGGDTGGAPPGLAAFDIEGNNLARWTPLKGTNNHNLNPGNEGQTMAMKTGKSDKPPQYLSVSAEVDSICLAWVNTIWTDPSGANAYKSSWYGSIGSQCGILWYPSQLPTPSGWMPNCTWIGPPDDHNADVYQQGMGIHLPSFAYQGEESGDSSTSGPGTGSQNNGGKKTEYEDDNNTMCNSQPRFWMYDRLTSDNCIPAFQPALQPNSDGTDPGYPTAGSSGDPAVLAAAIYQPGVVPKKCGPGPEVDTNKQLQSEWQDDDTSGGNTGSTIEKRTARRNKLRRTPRFDGHLVVSEHVAHNARSLCGDPTAHGPDMVTTYDKSHCDMETREVSAFCQHAEQEDCWHHKTRTLRRRGFLRARSEESQDSKMVEKRYTTVKHWKST